MDNKTFLTASLKDLSAGRPITLVTRDRAAASYDLAKASAVAIAAAPDECMYFATDLVHEGANRNGDVFTRREMERAWRSLLGMPVDVDHDMTVAGAVGKIYDAKYTIEGSLAVIRVAGFVHERFYPEVAWKLKDGIINGASMECHFERSERTSIGRILHGVAFVGMGIVRMPADPESYIDTLEDTFKVHADDRRMQIIIAAVEAAMTQELRYAA